MAAGGVRAAAERGLAVVLLVLLSPLLVLLGALVRLDSRGPALFRQTRVGHRGRRFTLLKLRTMTVGCDGAPHRDHVRRLLATGGAWAKLDTADPRVTTVGRWLRRTGLDELPQLVNVARGEMRFVGPRPAVPYEVEHWQPWHRERLAVPPGITGLWQVEARGAVGFDEMVALDLDYIARRSLWLDLTIVARTPGALWRTWRAG